MIKHSWKGKAVIEVIHKQGSVSWAQLLSSFVPNFYSFSGFHLFIRSLEKSGEIVSTYGGQKEKKRRIMLTLTDLGIKRWINGERDNLKKKVYVKKERSVVKQAIAPHQPIAKDPDTLPIDTMPCRRKVTLCYHHGCYLRFDCKVHPDYLFSGEDDHD